MADPKPQHPPISPEFVQDFIELQKSEKSLQAKQLELAKIEEDHKYEYACKMLDAQTKDRDAARTVGRKMLGQVLIFVGVLVIAALGFCAWAIAQQQGELVKEIVQGVLIFSGGLGAGFGAGFASGKKTNNKVTNPEA